MISANSALQEAVVEALRNSIPVIATVSGVYDSPPARAAFPYVSVADSPASDWSTKTAKGREIRLAVNVWDDGDDTARLQGLIQHVEAVIAGIPRTLTDWFIVSNVFLRSLMSRNIAGPWVGLVEYRIRMLATV